MWNTIIPVASEIHDKENLSYTYINMWTMVFYITFIPSNFPSNWLIEEKGLRVAVLVASVVFVVGSWLRVAFSYSPILALVGQGIASCSNPIVLNAPTKLSAVWFKTDSRNLATNIAAVSNILGNAIGALVPTWIVQPGSHYRLS